MGGSKRLLPMATLAGMTPTSPGRLLSRSSGTRLKPELVAFFFIANNLSSVLFSSLVLIMC